MRDKQKITDYFKQPAHAGELTHLGTDVRTTCVGSLEQGAVLSLHLQLDTDQRVQLARFKAYGCPATIAVGEFICRWAEGKALDSLIDLSSTEIVQALELPSVKLHSAILAVQALRNLSAAPVKTATTVC